MPPGPFLSVVIPAYNEEARIQDTLSQVTSYLQSQPYTWEVLVVDDGSDDSTGSLVEAFAGDYPSILLIRVPHRGKGWAVKNGMLRASGQYGFLCDADLSMPIEQLSRFFSPDLPLYDVAIGSREVAGARRIGEPWNRHLMGRLYNLMVRLVAVPRMQDTQCGFKCFRGEVTRDLFRHQQLQGFGFDVEILFLARREKLRIVEIPIDWYYRSHSKVRPLRDSFAMMGDLLRIRWNWLRGGYAKVGDATRERTF